MAAAGPEPTLKPCVYIISHGRYNPAKELIKVPSNITLYQYGKPRQGLHSFDVDYILKNNCNININPQYYVNKKSGRIYKSNFTFQKTLPNTFTPDLLLKFSDKLFKMGIIHTNGVYELFSKDIKEKSLKSVLDYLSVKYNYKNIIVVQISCKIGDYSKKSIDELSKQLKGTEIHDIEYITNIINNSKDYIIAKTKEEAIKISLSIMKLKRKKEIIKSRKEELEYERRSRHRELLQQPYISKIIKNLKDKGYSDSFIDSYIDRLQRKRGGKSIKSKTTKKTRKYSKRKAKKTRKIKHKK